ncbi:MAG: amine oxidase, partial [Azorhizobium sp. 35-67-15]
RDPHIGGGYSCALPGKAHVRGRLFAPLAERILFAGEAVSEHAFSTCHGAHLSGQAAARSVISLLKGTG